MVQAILEPDARAQEKLRRRRAAEAIRLAQARKIAWLVLAGCVVGATTAHFTSARLAHGAFIGGMAGIALGRFSVWLVGRLHGG